MKKIKIVAEIGCNHNGDPELAKKMVTIAKECGVDAVKFQTFKASELISKHAPKAQYQKITTGTNDSQLEMTQKLELSYPDLINLFSYAKSIGLEVFSTPFDLPSINFLAQEKQTIWKIPSGEITNLPYLETIAQLPIENKEILLSTGMSTIEEIKNAVEILKYNPTTKITILHCNTEYPTPYEDVNLNAIKHLKQTFPEHHIGFSDHSPGYIAAIAAVPYGIHIIEKHFTLDKNLPGPDHKASINPEELKQLCTSIRIAEKCLGTQEKIISNSEKKNKIIARKSIVAIKKIKKGERFNSDNISCKRPGSGISPMYWHEILGKEAQNDFQEDQLITDNRFPPQE